MEMSSSQIEQALYLAQMYTLTHPKAVTATAQGQRLGSHERQEDATCLGSSPAGVIAWVAGAEGGRPRSAEVNRKAASAAMTALIEAFRPMETHSETALKYAIDRAEDAVRGLIPEVESLGPCVTLVGGMFSDALACAYLANVGDCRCYRLYDGELDLLFKPIKAEWWSTVITGSEFEGRSSEVVVYAPFKLFPGNRFLLASNGIDVLGPEVIALALQRSDPEETVFRLLKAIDAAGHPQQDNVMVVVVAQNTVQGSDEKLSPDQQRITIAQGRAIKTKMVEAGLLIPESEVKEPVWRANPERRIPIDYEPWFSFNAIDERGQLFPAFIFNREIRTDLHATCESLYGLPAWICYRFFTQPSVFLDGQTLLAALEARDAEAISKVRHLAWMLSKAQP